MSSMSDRLTALTLAGLAGLHVAWGLGSTVPFGDRDQLADSVVGSAAVPGAAACFAVATALGTGAALVSNVPRVAAMPRRAGLLGMAAIFGARGGLGLIGRTDIVSPGSASDRFRQLDRRFYAPLCLVLAAGALAARHGSRGVITS
jgi:uncharacterized protein DUF3995